MDALISPRVPAERVAPPRELEVRPKQVKAWLESLPRPACVALPACWHEGELLAVPMVLPINGFEDAYGFSACFLHAHRTGRNIA